MLLVGLPQEGSLPFDSSPIIVQVTDCLEVIDVSHRYQADRQTKTFIPIT